ncbi:ER membrane protein complex subunit 3 [Bagarius yarrelli]|uniref:ER membrane protein complex subunit 3 n=1 Tax=Bagarius yarrelli TaxID=175774 RepID=A0A556V981_BAGYA|nr:ER membrane protein complex subunit 3 [Bagarius yarrelli]
MAGPELLLDSSIRVWVVLPIVLITFLVGVLRHYVTKLLQSEKKVEMEQVSDSQVLLRSRILRENGKYLPKQSFAMRKHYFNNAETGFFKKVKRKVVPKNPMTDTSMMTDMMKGNLTNVLPMILIGGWINWAFSGFVTTADQSRIMQEQMSGAAMAMPPDPNKAFKSEWEALEIIEHKWALEKVEEELMSQDLNFQGLFSQNREGNIF